MADFPIPATRPSRKSRPERGGNWKHGLSDHRLESIWESMKNRCYNPNADSYARYGARGITICEEWLANTGAFYQWALAHGYRDDLQIDRILGNEGYSPKNCRWLTHAEQQNNKSNNRFIEHEGEIRTLAQWSRTLGIPRNVLFNRLKAGWSTSKIFTTPVQANSRRKTILAPAA